MAVVRVREHVNPLSQKYQTPASAPDWSTVYAQPEQPLHLDIGCGRGRFLLRMAQLRPNWNFLGLEIRAPLVEQTNHWRDELGLSNLHYIFGNANNSLSALLRPGSLQGVTIQFPDPWFKRRHQKRRVVQPQLVADLATFLKAGAYLFLQSDVEAVAEEMRDRIADHPAFQPTSKDWLPENPMPVASEREVSTLEQGLPVYRMLFVRSGVGCSGLITSSGIPSKLQDLLGGTIYSSRLSQG